MEALNELRTTSSVAKRACRDIEDMGLTCPSEDWAPEGHAGSVPVAVSESTRSSSESVRVPSDQGPDATSACPDCGKETSQNYALQICKHCGWRKQVVEPPEPEVRTPRTLREHDSGGSAHCSSDRCHAGYDVYHPYGCICCGTQDRKQSKLTEIDRRGLATGQEYCSKCHKWKVPEGALVGINPDAICSCHNGQKA